MNSDTIDVNPGLNEGSPEQSSFGFNTHLSRDESSLGDDPDASSEDALDEDAALLARLESESGSIDHDQWYNSLAHEEEERLSVPIRGGAPIGFYKTEKSAATNPKRNRGRKTTLHTRF